MNIDKYKCQLEKLNDLDKNTPINLVLSGGAERGVAHLALLEKIEELELKINAISACSSGSLVGSMYASGKSTQEILKFFKETELFHYSWITFTKPGVFDSNRYSSLIEPLIAENFKDLKIPLTVSTTNMNKGITQYFNEGKLLKPVLASCAVPGLFNPIQINNFLYSDGGILDNFPIRPFKDSKLPTIGSNVSASVSELKNEDLKRTFKVLTHTFKLFLQASEEQKYHETFATICFPLGEFSGFDSDEVDPIYEKAKSYIKENC